MYVGIVGSEAAKFTAVGELEARTIIRQLLEPPDVILVSGGCHLGGVDIYAEEEADKLGRQKLIFAPKRQAWLGGYKDRNLQIAKVSNVVHCITVARLPETYKGMRFTICYHCQTRDHIKSGGCWTARRAKIGRWHVVSNPEGERIET